MSKKGELKREFEKKFMKIWEKDFANYDYDGSVIMLDPSKYLSFIETALKSKEKEVREEIGREFWKWFNSDDSELVEDAITRITKVKK